MGIFLFFLLLQALYVNDTENVCDLKTQALTDFKPCSRLWQFAWWKHSALVLFFFLSSIAASLLCYQQHLFLENCQKSLLLFSMVLYAAPFI